MNVIDFDPLQRTVTQRGTLSTTQQTNSDVKANRGYLEQVNTIICDAVSGWQLADRVRRLAMPSILYSEMDLQQMTLLMLDEETGNGAAVAAWQLMKSSEATKHRRVLELHGLYVARKWQRRGVGKSLIEQVEHCAWENSCDGVALRAWRQAESFFRACGYSDAVDGPSQQLYPRRLWKSI